MILTLPSPKKTKPSPQSCSEPIAIKPNQSIEKENLQLANHDDQCPPASPPSPDILELLLESLSLAEQPLPEHDEGLEVIVSKIVNTKIVFVRLVEFNVSILINSSNQFSVLPTRLRPNFVFC